MRQALYRSYRHARRVLAYGVLVVLILVACFVGIASEFLPWAEHNPDKIQAWLSERTGQKIVFSQVKGEWTRRGPRFALQGLRVGEGRQALDVGEADLLVSMYSGLLPGRPLTELKVSRLSLRLQQDDEGRWAMVGLPGKGSQDPLSQLEGFGELQIERARLSIVSQRHGWNAQLPRVDLRMRVSGSRLRVGVSAWVDEAVQPLDAVLDWRRDEESGLLWIGGRELALERWTRTFPIQGVRLLRAQADADVWVDVAAQKIRDVRVAVELEDLLAQANNDATPATPAKSVNAATIRWDEAALRLRYQRVEEGGRISVSHLQVEDAGGDAMSVPPFAMQWGEVTAVDVPEMPLRLFSDLLPLVPNVDAGLRDWMRAADLKGDLRDLRITPMPGGHWQGSARLQQAGFSAVGRQPGLDGLDAQLRFDAQGGVMRLNDAKPTLRWPKTLSEDLSLRLSGTLALQREDQDWLLSASKLRVKGEGFGLQARALMRFEPNGGAPKFDLAADLTPSDFRTAKKFWLRDRMAPNAVRWLDDSLVEGKVLRGRIAIGGDLSDWPFRKQEGRFDARADIADAIVRFSPDWPQARAFNADVAFDGPGFTVQAKADLLGNPVEVRSGGIADFADSLLMLDLRSATNGASLQELMRQSPLRKEHQAHLDAARVTGSTEVTMGLQLPLRAGADQAARKRIEGSLTLKDARLNDSRWGGVDFRAVNGQVRFSDRGFDTGPLNVRLDQQPAVFQLKVGESLGVPGLEARAQLSGVLPPSTLLRFHESLAWLKPYVVGSSQWQVQVDIPSAKGADSRLTVSSDLVGTRLKLPAPLDKPADMTLPLELQATLQARRTPVELSLGRLFAMRAVAREDAPLTGLIRFGGAVEGELPARGLRIDGRAGRMDAAGWIGFAAGDGASGGLSDVDLQVEQLLLLDRSYADTRLRLDRSPTATRIRLDGRSIAGSIDVPDAEGGVVEGRFSHLHLDSLSMTGNAATPAPASTTAEAGEPPPPSLLSDPAKVPALRFRIDDLRLGGSLLGVASLRTSPMPGGLRIEEFSTTGKALRIDAKGDWTVQAGAPLSRLSMRFSSNDLGEMLGALGFRGKIDGGKTTASLEGQWVGSPAEFSLTRFQGRLKADVGEGRLLDVEPGGSGRILGLVSITELPRRLTLDFSDFFSKGFAFNYMRGEFLIADGRAVTQRWMVDGPSSDIIFSGATDLRSQTYDQRVEVLPKAGGVLPAIGLLAGGPAGAAVGAVAQAVLQSPLKQATRTVYSLSGPWENPKTEVIEKGPAKKPPLAPPPSDAASEPVRNPEPAAAPMSDALANPRT